jgi:peptidyl-prolyl cis-trans isomerase A (cyclophilin A)
MLSFATAGANTRTTQVFINFSNNTNLDGQGFSPFGQVVTGMEVVDKINTEYGDQPEQPKIQQQGNAYLNRQFPRLDYIKKATIQAGAAAPAKKTTTKKKKS